MKWIPGSAPLRLKASAGAFVAAVLTGFLWQNPRAVLREWPDRNDLQRGSAVRTFDLTWDLSPAAAPAESLPGECLSRSEIVARTATLCQAALADTRGALEYRAERMTTVSPRHASGTLWRVHCRDSARVIAAHADWDARTGELRTITFSPEPDPERQAALGRDEALRVARFWIAKLAPSEGDWSVSSAPVCRSGSWNVFFQRAGRTARVQLDRRSGQLIWATLHLQPPIPTRGPAKTLPE